MHPVFEGGEKRMIQETAQITEEIRKAEEEKVRIESYTLDGQKPELYMCPGDL